MQIGGGNVVASARGLQCALLVNIISNPKSLESRRSSSGIQIAPVNVMRGKFSGAQIGIVNVTDSLVGLQIGLLNFIRHPGAMPATVMPLINFSW